MNPPRPVFLYRADGRIDYQAMHRAATRGLKSSKQIRADAERAAREAAKAAEKVSFQVETKPRPRALPP
ncbi:hypothetical protein FV226_27110, partial [Methylobacterium sp. WL12]|uniref:hypothetical protein n=1 Tax=Methylobacterium sp. WL12 TaxID=2603890 RepID=UPI0011CAA304